MIDAPNVERELGIEVFATSSEGIGGVLRSRFEDFRVEEIPLSLNQAQNLENKVKRNNYTVFWLEKRGLDTILAVKRIAGELGVSQKRFSFAGVKDRNALTLQRISVWKVPPGKLRELNLNRIRIKGITESSNPVKIGSHWGNHFSVLLRKIVLPVNRVEKHVRKTLDEIKLLGGMPNYFGHQRFGLKRPITHIVGLKILKGEFKDAAMTFLSQTSPYEREESTTARAKLAASEDFKSAIKEFPKQLTYELAVLNRLSTSPNNFINAFRVLPRRLLQMFISAAQSWLFNKFLSKRLKKNIRLDQCVYGDFVTPLDPSGLTIGEPVPVDNSNVDELNGFVKGRKSVVVYPVPGFDMKLPNGPMYDTVKETMVHEDLIPRSFWVNQMPELSSPGALRPIVITSKCFKTMSSSSNTMDGSEAKFEFSLVRGGYATVVLREFMKNDDPIAAGY